MADENEIYVSSLAKVAAIFGVTVKTIQQWLARDCPGKTANGYPVGAMVRWRCSELANRRTSVNGNGMADARTRRLHFQAERERLKYETETGELVTRADHDKAIGDWSAWFVGVITRLPGATAPVLAGKSAAQVKKKLATYCKELQREAFGTAQ